MMANQGTSKLVSMPGSKVDEDVVENAIPGAVRVGTPQQVGDTTISAVTFADERTSALGMSMPPPPPPIDSIATPDSHQTPGRKIHRKDVQNVFRGSTTTGTVSIQQIVRIKRIHDKISEGVEWDFNYTILLMVASIVAGIGLAIDSATTVISSMLLSPIMGPVIGMSYGLIIWDLKLIHRSMKVELLSILVCIIFGMLIGKYISYSI